MNSLSIFLIGLACLTLILLLVQSLRLRSNQGRLRATENELELQRQARVMDVQELERLRYEKALLQDQLKELNQQSR